MVPRFDGGVGGDECVQSILYDEPFFIADRH
jgi:hypothetical protein